jgi:ribosomal protein S27AE
MVRLAGVLAAGVLAAGCFGIPKGTKTEASVGALSLAVKGNAGIVSATAEHVTYKIKCSRCGYETEALTIQTPAAGKPYTYSFICPRCGKQEMVTVYVAP